MRKKLTTHKIFIKTPIVSQTNDQLRHNIKTKFNFGRTRSLMGPLNDDKMLNFDEMNNENYTKIFKN